MAKLIQGEASGFTGTSENPSNHNDYPSLKDLQVKNYPKNENEWVLCYSFFGSDYGTDTFTRDQIIEKYRENNRAQINNLKNLSANINACIKKDWLKSSGDQYILKPAGVDYANEVLAGRSISKEAKQVKRKPKQGQSESNE